MARRRSTREEPLEPRRPLVVVCRGGDCGSKRKHSGTDHLAQLRRLRTEVETASASVVTSKCLDACDFSNVIVVVPGARERAAGVEATWIGRVLDGEATGDVIAWVNAGIAAETPTLVQIQQFHPTRQSRRELSEPGTLLGYSS